MQQIADHGAELSIKLFLVVCTSCHAQQAVDNEMPTPVFHDIVFLLIAAGAMLIHPVQDVHMPPVHPPAQS